MGKDLVVSVTLDTFAAASTFGDSGPPFFGSNFTAGAEGYVYATPAADGGWGGEELPPCTASIGDYVWTDVNRNRVQDADELGIAGAAIYLYVPDTLDPTGWRYDRTTNTDSSGLYSFSGLCVGGLYRVEAVTPPNGYAPSTDQEIILTLTGDNQAIDFGFFPLPTGPLVTFTQGGWGSKPAGNNPGRLLEDHFNDVYPASTYPAGVVVGDSAATGCPTAPYRINFTTASGIQTFLPQGGKPAALTTCAPDPKKLTVLAGQVLALTLNVDFSFAAWTPPGLGMLRVVSGPLAGWTVERVLALGNWVLSGQHMAWFGADVPAGLTISQVNDVISKINENFVGGTTDKGYLQP
jgi:hypothetical protein